MNLNLRTRLCKLMNSCKLSNIPNILSKSDTINKLLNDIHLSKFKNMARIYMDMLKDYYNRKYTKVPINSIIAIVSSLTYLLTPVDMLPDLLPLGLLDDAGILALSLSLIKKDIDYYVEHKDRDSDNITNTDNISEEVEADIQSNLSN